ncbi:hypothetical protein WA026_019685 [Henosepilachna vigintioctopunctata]|uniref:Major facilitator superfamily (MFS) profile domain-containing protein n=1 Tax=Henosepilachna vigintioctopunctata TaxID=420089 RepID=A0AAW1UNR4_9CUCU
MYNSTANLIPERECNIRSYKYRWIIINIFGLFCGINFMQYLQFTIIANIVRKYYNVDTFSVDMSGLVFMAFYILLFIPAGYIVERTSLKTVSIIASGLTALGNCLKLLAISPDRYYVILASQSLCAIAQIFILIIPTKVACTWFGADEVSTACSIGIFGTQIGLAVGSILPTIIVNDSNDLDTIGDGLNTLFLYNAVASIAIFLVVIIFFRSKPPSPPSESQAELVTRIEEEKMSHWAALKGFAKNKDFLIVLCTLGLAFGLWNCFGILVNQMFSYSFPNESNALAGFLTSAAIISGGCFGTVFFGYLLDRTHKFKWISCFALTSNTILSILQAVFMLTSNKIATCIIIPLNGFYSGSMMVIAYEYAAETTYPVPEALGASILNVIIYLIAIIYVVILSLIFDNVSYLAGYIVIVGSLAMGTFPILWISTELKRRNANLKT